MGFDYLSQESSFQLVNGYIATQVADCEGRPWQDTLIVPTDRRLYNNSALDRGRVKQWDASN